MWDIGGDSFDSMDIENAGILEIAVLIELETVLIDPEGNASI